MKRTWIFALVAIFYQENAESSNRSVDEDFETRLVNYLSFKPKMIPDFSIFEVEDNGVLIGKETSNFFQDEDDFLLNKRISSDIKIVDVNHDTDVLYYEESE